MVEYTVLASFVMLTFLPFPFSIGHNNLNPSLKIGQDKVVYKVLFSENTLPLDQIEIVDVSILPALKTFNLEIRRKKALLVPVFNLAEPELLKKALQQLKSQGAPLSTGASEFLSKP